MYLNWVGALYLNPMYTTIATRWVYAAAAAANERNLLDECVRLRRPSERGRSGAGSAAEITLREADGRWARRRRSKRYGAAWGGGDIDSG